MLLRVSLFGGSVIGLNIWQANKVHAAEPSTSEQPPKKKIRPSEVTEPICFFFSIVLLQAMLTVSLSHIDKILTFAVIYYTECLLNNI